MVTNRPRRRAALTGGALRKEFEIDHAAAAAIIHIIDKLSGRVWTIFKLMKFLSLLFGAMLLPALAARATDDMRIYSGRLNNMTQSN